MQSTVLITIPCYNEELVLRETIATVVAYAEVHLTTYAWQVLIIDNASSDTTWKIASDLTCEYTKVRSYQVQSPGRGAALRESWNHFSGFDVYLYMDADLATDLKDLLPLIRGVASYDIVVGSRYLKLSDSKRIFGRLISSRIYNFLLYIVFGVTFYDAQCGFKAFRRRVVEDVVSRSRDAGWFWDAEVMIVSLRKGYTLLEIPVSWREVRNVARKSKVSVPREIWRQLVNMYWLHRRL
jgi:glycosyltransferase involved in cell wall biosynthesis